MKRRESGNGPAQREQGQILILFVLMLGVLLGFMALALDVGMYLNERRQLQNAADAAALAGAQELWPMDAGSFVDARLKAQQWASDNGFSDGVTINTPYDGDPLRIEVIIDTDVPMLFASVLGSSSFSATARAVASAGLQPVQAAFLILNETECRAFEKSGSGDLIINGGGIMVNSECDPDGLYLGGSGDVAADAIEYFDEGGVKDSGSGDVSPDPLAVPDRVDDPLAGLAPPFPSPPAGVTVADPSPDSGGTALNPSTLKLNSTGPHELSPGVYYGGIEIGSSANVNLLPGVYVMAGGGFKLGGSGIVKSVAEDGIEGILLYNTFDPANPSGDGECEEIELGGGGSFLVEGYPEAPYKDIVFWQDGDDDSDCAGEEMKLRGNGNTIGGVIYLPNSELDLGGNGPLGSIQVIADSVKIHGSGDMDVDFTAFIDIPLKTVVKLTE